ncbi:sugar transferase, partial [Campylobacter sp.]
IFKIYKFRTMSDERDENGNLLPDELRLKGFGTKLRASSIDELPQLFNVLKGDMSFIGPRPLLVEYLPLYSPRQASRHSVRPGITGLAQVNGRNDISWTAKLEYDALYAEKLSFLLDIKIAILSIKKVLKKEGVSKAGMATTEKFNGRN